jgi:transcriptional regulator with XRE-family HTH domain
MSDMHKFREMLAKQLKEMRVNTDMTQAKLSEQMGVSVVHLSNLENGHSLPSIELLRKYESCFWIRSVLCDERFIVLGEAQQRGRQPVGIKV